MNSINEDSEVYQAGRSLIDPSFPIVYVSEEVRIDPWLHFILDLDPFPCRILGWANLLGR